MHDDQFTAVGPSHHSSGKAKTAFSTWQVRDFEYGVNMQGLRCGVYGESGPVGGSRDSTVDGVGVQGTGSRFGVLGHGGRGIAGVYGHAIRSQVGVLGAAMRDGIGVVGVSLSSIGNPAQRFESVDPTEADGSRAGVIGASGEGAGVQGFSQTGNGGEFISTEGRGVTGTSTGGRGGEFSSVGRAGVRATSIEGNGGEFRSAEGEAVSARSDSGVAVHAISRGERGGVFESGKNIAQINLVPLVQTSENPQLPKEGAMGDLLMIENVVSLSGRPVSSTCSLWLCVSSPMILVAQWREVQLGSVVTGTI